MTNPFGVYVHFPYCVHRCSYCDFFSLTEPSEDKTESVVSLIVKEICAGANWLSENRRKTGPVTSVFLGGGTPSLMPISQLTRVLDTIEREFGLDGDAELTLEANPETVDEALAKGLEQTQINRVSLGVQSFTPELLKLLERRATPAAVRAAVQHLRSAGFQRLSLDLIFGIPGQNYERMRYDIEQVVALNPDHISFYNLTLKPGHALYSQLPSDDACADLYEAGVELLTSHGFERYEISNFARPGQRSRHNLLYWSGDDFFGFGPSAASRFFWDGSFYHRKQVADLNAYRRQGQNFSFQFDVTSSEQTALEAVFLELRKTEGIRQTDFVHRYGYDVTRHPKFAGLKSRGLLVHEGDQIRLTPSGLMLADSIAVELG